LAWSLPGGTDDERGDGEGWQNPGPVVLVVVDRSTVCLVTFLPRKPGRNRPRMIVSGAFPHGF
jgi:hypothetical protein